MLGDEEDLPRVEDGENGRCPRVADDLPVVGWAVRRLVGFEREFDDPA